MGLVVLFSALVLCLVQILFYLSDLYNVHIFDRISQDMSLLAISDLEFDYIISRSTCIFAN